eukprot:Filipodium_phascolosomae@DN6242_c0_g1_i1.p1
MTKVITLGSSNGLETVAMLRIAKLCGWTPNDMENRDPVEVLTLYDVLYNAEYDNRKARKMLENLQDYYPEGLINDFADDDLQVAEDVDEDRFRSRVPFQRKEAIVFEEPSPGEPEPAPVEAEPEEEYVPEPEPEPVQKRKLKRAILPKKTEKKAAPNLVWGRNFKTSTKYNSKSVIDTDHEVIRLKMQKANWIREQKLSPGWDPSMMEKNYKKFLEKQNYLPPKVNWEKPAPPKNKKKGGNVSVNLPKRKPNHRANAGLGHGQYDESNLVGAKRHGRSNISSNYTGRGRGI